MANGTHDLIFDVAGDGSSNRVTTFFRLILMIPHAILLGLWGYAAGFAAVAQWFVVLFTGERNRGIWNFHRGYLSYAARVNSYIALQYDQYPGFFSDWNNEPIAFDLRVPDRPDRLTNALRFIWVIPAAIVLWFIEIGAAVVAVIAWFAILFTGRYPKGLQPFAIRALRMSLRVTAYAYLATDDYPWYDGNEPTGVTPPGDGAARTGSPLPPPPPAATRYG